MNRIMMIEHMNSAKIYYESELVDKDKTELQEEIRKLRRDLSRLKATIDHPEYDWENKILPEYETLCRTREHLEMAKKAYSELGGVDLETISDKYAHIFRERLPFLQKIRFTISRGFLDHSYAVYVGKNDRVKSMGGNTCQTYLPLGKRHEYLFDDIRTRDELNDYLDVIHIEEWNRHYDLRRYGWMALDGDYWEIGFFYNNGSSPYYITGSNSYPYNFEQFLWLFGLDLRNRSIISLESRTEE